jgi:hypothetical protein
LPECSDFLEGDEPAADKVEAFLAKALGSIAANPKDTARALVPWICDVLLLTTRSRPTGAISSISCST